MESCFSPTSKEEPSFIAADPEWRFSDGESAKSTGLGSAKIVA